MSFRTALAFFTRLPTGLSAQDADFHGIIAWLPMIGILIGILVSFAVVITSHFFPSTICGLLSCFLWVLITGGLHLDGLADCGDGLIVEASPARRLEIMQDPQMGTFGGIALFFVLMTKVLTLSSLAGCLIDYKIDFIDLIGSLCLTTTLGRSLVLVAMRVPSAREGGLGESLAKNVTCRQIWLGLTLSFVLALNQGIHGMCAMIFASLVAFFLITSAKKRLGGVTGDVYGCLIEIVESSVLLCLMV